MVSIISSDFKERYFIGRPQSPLTLSGRPLGVIENTDSDPFRIPSPVSCLTEPVRPAALARPQSPLARSTSPRPESKSTVPRNIWDDFTILHNHSSPQLSSMDPFTTNSMTSTTKTAPGTNPFIDLSNQPSANNPFASNQLSSTPDPFLPVQVRYDVIIHYYSLSECRWGCRRWNIPFPVNCKGFWGSVLLQLTIINVLLIIHCFSATVFFVDNTGAAICSTGT